MFFNDEGQEFTITDRVCNTCNSQIGICEGELCYAGPEAMLRKMVGIKGRSRRVKYSPFYENPFARHPVRLYGKFKDQSFPVLLEIDQATGHARECCQLVFTNPQNGKIEHITLRKGMTRRGLVDTIKEMAGRTDIEYNIYYDEVKDQELLKQLLGRSPEKIFTPKDGVSEPEVVDTRGVFTITEKHHRAIAKIAFTYMMYHRVCGIRGYESEFSSIKNFIRYGTGHPNKFVRLSKKHVLSNSDIGWRPRDCGHIVTCNVGGVVRSCVHLFTGGSSSDHGAYVVNLGRSPYAFIRCNDAVAHWFRITSKPGDLSDSGEIKVVNIIQRIITPDEFGRRDI